MLENVHGRRRRYHNCFEKRWNYVEKFICQLYQPGTGISKVKDLRWHKCSEKNQAESDSVPPTQGAL